MFLLIHMLIGVFCVFVDERAGISRESEQNGLTVIYGLATFVPWLAVAVRRLHDTGRTGRWLLFALVPLIGPLTLLVFLVEGSQEGENQYGPNPKMVGLDAVAQIAAPTPKAGFNLFEGSRRLGLLLKVLWVVLVAVITYSSTPHVFLKFTTTNPNEPFQFAESSDCEVGTDGIEFINRDLDNGRGTSVQLCFSAQRFGSSGERLVPYKIESGTMWGQRPYSSEVQRYMEERAARFLLSAADTQWAVDEWNAQRRRNLGNGFLFMLGGWIVLSVLQSLIGWIVRGFLGIPWGQDQRLEPPPATV